MATQRTKLFALLAAVDKYAPPVRPLHGCVNDIVNFEKYLNSRADDFELSIETLFDEAATKGNIVQLLQQQLEKAGPDDVFVFYYSGHGAQEWADKEIWRFEADQKLEGLVCYDSIPSPAGPFNLLVDKELRFLLRKAVKGEKPPHIVTIFDCCHSGDVTRNLFVARENNEAVARRFEGGPRMSAVLPKRDWSQFVFHDAVDPKALQTQTVKSVLPEVPQVNLSACSSNESAFEVNGGGVFSGKLLEVLERSAGDISYYDLKSRLKYFIKNQFQQTPRIYEAGSSDHLIHQAFLNRGDKGKPLYGNVIKNPKTGWVLDMGAMHGISRQAETVIVFPEGKEEEKTEARISRVGPSETALQFDTMPDEGAIYKGYVQGFLSAPVSVFLADETNWQNAAQQLKTLLKRNGKNVFVVEEETQADYTVRVVDGRMFITPSGYWHQPLVYPPADLSMQSVEEISGNLQAIAQWEYVKNLHNDGPNQLPVTDVKVEVFRVQANGTEEEIPIDNDCIHTAYEEGGFEGSIYGGSIRIKLTNQSKDPLFVGLVYLGSTFEIYNAMLDAKVERLEPGSTVWVFDGEEVELVYEPKLEIFNLPASLSYFQLIFSKQEFEVELFKQDALSDPGMLGVTTKGRWSPLRGIRRKKKNASADAWGTRLLELKIDSPRYNDLSKEEIEQLLQTEAAPFVKDAYAGQL